MEGIPSQNNNLPSFEQLKDLDNVENGLNILKNKLESKPPNWEVVKKTLYELLTSRSSFAKEMHKNNNDLSKVLESFKEERSVYNETVRTTLSKWVKDNKGFAWDSNPGWFCINTRAESPRRDEISIKTYATIPIEQYDFVKHIPELAQEFRVLSLESDDIIQVKVPENFATFYSKNDSIVIHYKKSENSEKIQEILSNWMRSNSIQEEPREMGRVKVAADSKTSSFSDLVVENITKWLQKNYGKYDNAVLAEQGVKYAIEQSQKTPEIVNA